MQRARTLPVAAVIGACAANPAQMPLKEIAHSAHCNTPAGSAPFAVLGDAGQLRQWQQARNVTLSEEPAGEARYLAIEMGRRPTGGYRIAVEPSAVLENDLLRVTATFSAPGPGAMVSQAITSPCTVLELPAGDYQRVEVRGPDGAELPVPPAKPAVPAS